MAKNQRLSLVDASTSTASSPPATLGEPGRTLWTSIMSEYDIVDSGGLGSEVNLLLRMATLPGAEFVLPLLASQSVLGAGRGMTGAPRALAARGGARVVGPDGPGDQRGSDAVTLAVKFGALSDNTGYTAQTTLEAKAKNIRVVVENSGHRPLAQ